MSTIKPESVARGLHTADAATWDAFARSRLELQLSTDLLNRIEQDQRAILAELNCPADPVVIYAILNGEQPAPWPAKHATRDRQRAKLAMFVLRFVAQTRHYLRGPHENARMAVYWAMHAAAFGGDVVRLVADAHIGGDYRRAQRKRSDQGVQIRKENAERSDQRLDVAIEHARGQLRRQIEKEPTPWAIAKHILAQQPYSTVSARRKAISRLSKRITRHTT